MIIERLVELLWEQLALRGKDITEARWANECRNRFILSWWDDRTVHPGLVGETVRCGLCTIYLEDGYAILEWNKSHKDSDAKDKRKFYYADPDFPDNLIEAIPR